MLNKDALGWARHPLQRCNFKNDLRKKRWNHWVITNDDYFLLLATINTGMLKCMTFYFYDCREGREYDFSKKFLTYEDFDYGNDVYTDVLVKKGSFFIEEKNTDEKVNITGMAKEADFNFEIDMKREKESMNIIVPWNENKFQFTSKQNCLPVCGEIRIESRKFTFDAGSSFAALDFGHGKWPYKTHWNWSTASGKIGNDSFGLNLGSGWTEGTGTNENAVYLNSKVFKIEEEVKYTYDPLNYFNPWIIESEESDCIDIYFEPKSKKISKSNLIFLKVNLLQMVGYYYGNVKIDGKVFELKKIPGCIEEQYALW